MEPSKKISLNTNQYTKEVVVFIDIIGFGEFVGNNDENNTFAEVMDLFSFSIAWKSSGHISATNNRFDGFRPAFHFFSDTIMLAFPLNLFIFNSPDSDNELLGKQALLASINDFLIEIQIGLLRKGMLSRGCIHIGKIYHNEGLWFGPAINQAYIHEKRAIYPRIILTETTVRYFGENLLNNLSYKEDNDKFYYFNYIGWLHGMSESGDHTDGLSVLRDVVSENIRRIEANIDSKPLEKWKWLQDKLI